MGTFGYLVMFGCVAALFIFFGMEQTKSQNRATALIQQASDDYQEALIGLKADPTNADLKQKALGLGRKYAALTREQKSVTIFDEMALSNDIAAATAGATKATAGISVEDRLNALEGLRNKGLVSDAEYTQKRQKLLDEM